MTAYTNHIQEYWCKIQSGEIVVGEYIRQIYERLTAGLRDGLFFFDGNKADKVITFTENYVHHCEGRDDHLKLELWQKAALSAIFGIVDEDGLRVFREVFLVVARKNGKSLFADAVALAMSYIDNEYGAKIFCIAPKLEQAHIVYDNFYRIVQAEPELDALAKKRRSDIYIESTNTSIKPLAFSSKKSDGLNPHLVVADELSSWSAEQGLKQYEVLKSALGARKQPLIFSITTAGYVNDGIYDELMKRSTAYLNRASEETRLLPLLYVIDDINKWDDLEELKKSNPNMNVSVTEDFFKEEIAIAKNSMSKHAEFMTKYCNIKQNSSTAWMPYEVLDDCCQDEFTLDSLRNSYGISGLDLSQTTDLTSACVIVEKEGILYVISQFFMPSNKIAELQEREGVPYDIYVKQGLITPSGENFVDYNDCFKWFCSLVEDYQIYPLQVGYDRYSAQYLIQQLESYGFKCDDVFQGTNLSSCIHEMDGLIRDKKIRFGKNNLLKAHILNVAMKQDVESRKVRPVKIDSMVHIDGFVAVIDALTVRQKWFETIGEQLKNL